MFVSGFTIARNVVKSDYPLKESIFSILPLCDEFVVAVGNSDDGTLEFVKSFDHPKIRIIETVWDEKLREGGRVLADETNKALKEVNPKSDWCFYIQADECVHENDLDNIKIAMETNLDNLEVDGLLFSYKHFYGTYDFIADSRSWYRNEVRIIRNNCGISSFLDAQGFRRKGQKITAAMANASIYHYGWVKHPQQQQTKQLEARRWWHSDAFLEENVAGKNQFNYNDFDSLKKFEGTHPEVMKERVQRLNWEFKPDLKRKKMNFKKRFLYELEKITGYRAGEFKNYKLLK